MNKTRVHVGGLPQYVRESDLEHFFRGYGRIREILLKDGFGYVELSDQRDAADAVFELHGKTLLGRKVTVQRAREIKQVDKERSFTRSNNQKENHEQYRVIVENLSTRVQWQELKDIMSRFGEVDFAKSHNLRPNEGMVQFANYHGMRRAIENLDRTELDGQRIRMIAKENQHRQRSRSPIHRPRPNFRSRSPIRKSRSIRNTSFKKPYQERDEINSNFRRASRF